MPSEIRLVTVAPGHAVNVRRLRKPASRAGYVRVETKDSRQFDVPQQAWDAAEVRA